MRRAINYLTGGLAAALIVIGYLHFFGLPRTKPAGSALAQLLFVSIACLGYGVFLAYKSKNHVATTSQPRLPPRGHVTEVTSFTETRSSASTGAVPDSELYIAGRRQILWPAQGIALVIGNADLNAGGSFLATAYMHPAFVGLEEFPSISDPKYSGLRHETPFSLRPIGTQRQFEVLSLQLLMVGRGAGSPARFIGSPGGKAIAVLELIARTVPLLPNLSHWQQYAKDGRVTSIIIPSEVASAMNELGLPRVTTECRFPVASGATAVSLDAPQAI
jgi:hypothetical protein